MDPKNICIESQVLNHRRRSGLMTYTEGLINGLYSNDRDNQYTLAYYSLIRNGRQMPGPEGENFRKDVLRIPERDFILRQPILDQVILPSFLRAKKIRVFHRPAGYTIPRVKGVFSVLTVHDLRTMTIGDKLWSQNIDQYRKTFEVVDACVVVSEFTKKEVLEHFKINEKKIKVIYLGTDQRFRLLPKAIVADRLKELNIQQPYLLSIGSVPRKNIPGIIRGFAGSKFRDKFTLVLGVTSGNHGAERYHQLAVDLGVSSQVKILYNLKDEDIVVLYNGCHCFLFPSLCEGFGLPILEAMQCGAPVITSNISSCPEVAGDSAILVDPQKIDEISDAIDHVCTSEPFRQDLIRKGFERSKLFAWDKYAREIQKVYAEAS